MIFVTVGTHEQPFNRLVESMDKWAGTHHDEEVFIQTGYTTYEPKHCRFAKFLTREEMIENMKEARIVVTHGGPCCYTDVLRSGKVPIVVPRRKKLGEQIDDHQLEIGRQFARQYKNILLIEDVDKIGDAIAQYDELTKGMDLTAGLDNNAVFCETFSEIIDTLLK